MKNRLKELRKQRGLTLDAIARETGILRGTYNNYENGKTRPRNEKTWTDLADFFGVTVPYLQGYGWSDNEVFNFLFFTYADGFLNHYGIPMTSMDDIDIEYYEVDGKVYKYGYDFMVYDEFTNGKTDKDLLINSAIYLPDKIDRLVPSLKNTIRDQFDKFEWGLLEIPKFQKNFADELQTVKELVKPMFYKQLPILYDYAFMSTIDDKLDEYGISGEYQIAEELSKEIAFKEISERKDRDSSLENKAVTLIKALKVAKYGRIDEFLNLTSDLTSDDLEKLIHYMQVLKAKRDKEH